MEVEMKMKKAEGRREGNAFRDRHMKGCHRTSCRKMRGEKRLKFKKADLHI